MTPSVSTLGSVPPGGHRWRRARYGSAPLASRVADAIAARRPSAALDPRASAAPEGQETRAGRGPAPLERAAPCGRVAKPVPRKPHAVLSPVRGFQAAAGFSCSLLALPCLFG